MINVVQNRLGFPVAVIDGIDYTMLRIHATRLKDDPTEPGSSRDDWARIFGVLTEGEKLRSHIQVDIGTLTEGEST